MHSTIADAASRSVHLLGHDNGVGLSRDLHLLTETLRGLGYRVDFTNVPPRAPRRRGGIPGLIQRSRRRWHEARCARRRRLGLPLDYDLALMAEHIASAHLVDAGRRLLLPNPDWFEPRDLAALDKIDVILAKTRETQRIFSTRGCHVVHTGFTGDDRLDASVPREQVFFHLAGRSRNKGTQTLLALWRKHPEWPRLTVVQNPHTAQPGLPAPNITHRIEYIPDTELKHLQNAHRFHLCPSETEGFGHYIVEAMSVGAVVVTLDAPPMNEIVTPARGVLIPPSRTGAQHLATTYFYDEGALQSAVERLLAVPEAELERIGAAARAWFEAERKAFPTRLDAALRQAGTHACAEPC